MRRRRVVVSLALVSLLLLLLSGEAILRPAGAGDPCNCCHGGDALGCDDSACEAEVCAADFYCCDFDWDSICDSAAISLCDCCTGVPTCTTGTGLTCNCCEPFGSGLGCDDPICEAAVCAIDEFCCVAGWDPACADEAAELCTCCPTGSGPDTDGDGIDDSCDHCPNDPDADHDGFGTGSCPPGLPADCDDGKAGCTSDCTDADGDGFCPPQDCNDGDPACSSDCSDSDSDGVCDPSDNCPTVFNPNQGARQRLNDPPAELLETGLPAVSADGASVVYIGQSNILVRELYVSPSSGIGPTKKPHPDFPTFADVTEFAISPDGARVVYLADQEVDQRLELFSVPIGGGTPVKLNGALVSGGDVAEETSSLFNLFAVSLDSARVIYVADQEVDEKYELYSVPIGGGTPVKLNGALVSGGDLQRLFESFAVSADSASVVYVADQQTDNKNELFSVPIGGGTAVQLNPPMGSGSAVEGPSSFRPFALSPDGATVVYVADQDASGQHEVYSVPIGGGTAVKLNGPLIGGGDVGSLAAPFLPFAVSPDGARVVYVADQEVNDKYELYSVPIGGGTAVKLNGSLIAAGDVDATFAWESPIRVSPDGTTVIYRADQEVDNEKGVYSVPIGGGTAVQLNGPDTTLVQHFALSPDGSRLVYRGNGRVYSVPIGGGSAVQLAGGGVAGVTVQDQAFRVSPDSAMVIYRADQDVSDRFELYRVPIGGGTAVKLNGPMIAPGTPDVQGFVIDPTSTTVLYVASQDYDESLFDLHRVSMTIDVAGEDSDHDGLGGACDCDDGNAQCTTDCTDADDDGFCPPQDCDDVSPTCTTSCIDADDDGLRLCEGDCDDANPSCTTSCTDADGDGLCATVDCDDQNAGCTVDCTDDDGDGFCPPNDCDDNHAGCWANCTDADGDGYCPPLDCDDSQPLCITACADDDGDGLCAEADCDDDKPQCTDDCTDADGDGYCLPLDCDDAKAGCTVSCTDADGDGFCPPEDCNDSAAFCTTSCADSDGDGFCAGVDCDDSLPACGLDCTDSDVDGICVEADCDDGAFGCTVACADPDDDGVCDDSDNCPEVPNPNQEFRARLNDPPVRVQFSNEQLVVSPDGKRVLFHAQESPAVTVELFASHISGNGVTTKLNPTLGASSMAVLEYVVSADGSTVVYRADQDVDEVFELYSVPVDGGPSTQLNAPLVSGGDVTGFLVTGDGATVVYRANQDHNQFFELYSVPIGGGPVVELSQLIGIQGMSVQQFRISPDGATVVYRADQDVVTMLELYSVPIGGGPTVQLNGPLISAGDVASSFPFAISADSTRVVYLADAQVDQRLELFSVPIGGGTPVKLNGPLVSGGNVSSASNSAAIAPYLISPDSASVIYLADQELNARHEIYSVPIGGGSAVKLNGPLVGGGDIAGVALATQPFLVSPDSARVVYHADQEVDNKFELYSVPIGGGSAVKLNGPLGGLGDVGTIFGIPVVPPFGISPDGNRAVYLADPEIDDRLELYSVPIGGGTAVKLNGPLVSGGTVAGSSATISPFLLSPDSATVVYRASQDTSGQAELYIVPIGGGTSAKLSGSLVPQGNVDGGFAMDPESSTVAFLADAEQDGTYDVYRVSATFDAAGADRDHDGFGGACDCDDTSSQCTTGCGTDADSDGLCAAIDCDDTSPTCTTSCVDGDGDGLRLCQGDCNDAHPSCTTDCTTDGDGDAMAACADCDDGDATVRHAPLEVAAVLLDGAGSTTIHFETQDGTAGTSTSYHVVTGTLAALTASGSYASAACLGTFADAPALDPLADPASGTGRYYLVRAVNGCGTGTYGDSTVVPDPRDGLDAGGVCP